MKKIVFILLIIGFISNGFASEKDICVKENVCCNTFSDTFAFNHSKDLDIACPNKFYVYSDFLWMQSKEDALEYATFNKNQNLNGDFTPPLADGKIIDVNDFDDYKPGFKIGFGSFFTKDKWNAEATWTYLKIKHTSEVSVNQGYLLSQFTGAFSDGFNIKTASATWSGDYNTLDLSIGKEYHISRYFISKPLIGIRAAWINQNYHVRYFPTNISFNDSFIPFKKFNIFFDNEFWGVGLRGFYEGDFLLTKNWSIYGKVAFALLFSEFNTSQRSDGTNVSQGVKYEFENTFFRIQSNNEIGIGIVYQRFFDKNKYLVSFKAGYELYQWWDQFNDARILGGYYDLSYLTSTVPLPNGDLSFNGFVFGLNIDF